MSHDAEKGTLSHLISRNKVNIASVVNWDKPTMLLLITVWLAALLMVGVAVYTANRAYSSIREAREAEAIQPVVPTMKLVSASTEQVKEMGSRIEKMFNGLKADAGTNTLRIYTGSADMYMEWITSLGYVDVMQPDVRWSIREMCIGPECSLNQSTLMSALLVAEKFSFDTP